MKKLIVIFSLMVAVLYTSRSTAQIHISINIGHQPEWGPVGYDYVDYYYLPDINTYYNVATAQYIFLLNNKWHFAKKLPGFYHNYDVYNAYKVVVNRPDPYLNNRYDIDRYGMYKGYHSQPILRNNAAYRAVRGNGVPFQTNTLNRKTPVRRLQPTAVVRQPVRTVYVVSRVAPRSR